MANFIKLISCLLILVKSYTVAAPVSPVLGTAELASNTMPGCWVRSFSTLITTEKELLTDL